MRSMVCTSRANGPNTRRSRSTFRAITRTVPTARTIHSCAVTVADTVAGDSASSSAAITSTAALTATVRRNSDTTSHLTRAGMTQRHESALGRRE
jgi:hypothetical protein